jgi:hypothetical protein
MDHLPVRKGRKPNPANEEEKLQQEEEKKQSKLRKAKNRNATRRANYVPKMNMGPVLGDAVKPTENKKIKIVGPSKPHNRQSNNLPQTEQEIIASRSKKDQG